MTPTPKGQADMQKPSKLRVFLYCWWYGGKEMGKESLAMRVVFLFLYPYEYFFGGEEEKELWDETFYYDLLRKRSPSSHS